MNLKQIAQQRLADMFTLAVDDQNKNLAMNRAAAAKLQGLDPTEYGTVFPGTNINVTLPPDPPPAPAPAPATSPTSTAQTAMNYVLAALTAGGLTLGGTSLLSKPAVPATPAATATVPAVTPTPTPSMPAAVPAPAAVVAPASPIPSAPAPPAPQVYDVEQQQQPDGSWKTIWKSPAPRPQLPTDKLVKGGA